MGASRKASRFRKEVHGGNTWLAAVVLLLGCGKESSEAREGSAPASASTTGPNAAVSAAPSGNFGCHYLVEVGVTEPARTIALSSPDPAKKTIVLDKTGVVVTFSRSEFLTTARCLNLNQAVDYVEHVMGDAQQSPLRDAFQLSYVAAALLDTGRVGVKLKNEKAPRKTIFRESWSEKSCAGKCTAFGRIYRLSESDPWFFFRVVDKKEDREK